MFFGVLVSLKVEHYMCDIPNNIDDSKFDKKTNKQTRMATAANQTERHMIKKTKISDTISFLELQKLTDNDMIYPLNSKCFNKFPTSLETLEFQEPP